MANVKNIYAAEPTAVGSIYAGPLGTAAPALATDPSGATATLNVAYINLGDVGDNGFTQKSDRKIVKKRNFGGKVVKVLQTEFGMEYELVFLESLNADVLKAIHGTNNVDYLAATALHGNQIVVRKNAKRLPHLSWVIDTIDSGLGVDSAHPALYRTYIPDGQITDTGDVKIVHTDTIEYKVTIEAFETNGNHVLSWSDDGQLGTPTNFLVTLGAQSSGTFTLTYGGLTTGTIAYNATNATVKTALVALDDGFDASRWTVTGSAGGPYTVTVPVPYTALTGSGALLGTPGTFAITPV